MTVALESEAELSLEAELLAGLTRAAELMLDALGLQDAELSVVLVEDATIRELNATHRGLDEPTDVLAFPMDFADDTGEVTAPPEAGRWLGDVVLSVPTAARQARTAGHRVEDELVFLLAHGLLHLVGHDHAEAEEKAEMDRETARLVAAATPADR
jgi:probable rRNA maturation factor